jgi:hypothetical protein
MLALDAVALAGLSRSDAVHVGDISDGPMGTMFLDVNVSHFMNPDDVRVKLRIQLDHAGEFMGASERADASPTPTPPAPAPGGNLTGADRIRDLFSDVGLARETAILALQDLGIGGLSRSDAVHVGDISDGPMGSYFVNLDVAHFMNANDVRASVRVQVGPQGNLIGASQR